MLCGWYAEKLSGHVRVDNSHHTPSSNIHLIDGEGCGFSLCESPRFSTALVILAFAFCSKLHMHFALVLVLLYAHAMHSWRAACFLMKSKSSEVHVRSAYSLDHFEHGRMRKVMLCSRSLAAGLCPWPQLLEAVTCLHENWILHRDIKARGTCHHVSQLPSHACMLVSSLYSRDKLIRH
jgi:serine/threonine protein kinase